MARRWSWIDVAIAPLRWVERARGWRRLALLGGYMAVAVGVIVPLLREASLWRIPNIPEPVDRAKYGQIVLPDAENAAILYREAARLLTTAGSNHPQSQMTWAQGAAPTWQAAAPAVRAWVEANRAARDRWLAGTLRDDALFHQPTDDPMQRQPWSMALVDLQALAFLGAMSASQLEETGDLAGAWPYRLAVVRAAVHAQRHRGAGEAYLSDQFMKQAITQARFWVGDDRQTGALLRQACHDLQKARALVPSAGDLIRDGYFDAERVVGWMSSRPGRQGVRPDDSVESVLVQRGRDLLDFCLSSEPRRSQRILRLLTAGQLAQVDRPAAERASLVGGYLIYAIDDHTPEALRSIRPETLVALAESSGCRDYLLLLNSSLTGVRISRDALDALIQQAAERAYALDHGHQPPRTYGDLVPTYLDALPEGMKLGDPLAAP